MPSNGAQAYQSLTELKTIHSRLLKSYGQLDQLEVTAASHLPPELLAQMREFIRRGRATGAILDNLDDRWDSQGLLDYWATVLYQAGNAKDKETGRVALAEFDPALAPTLEESQCPYQGLSAFQEAKQKYFFGRDFLVQSLLELLPHQRLLAVVGPSGSGKSSLVLAGLLPALRQGKLPGSQDWRFLEPMIPGATPLASLAHCVKPASAPAAPWQTQHIALFKQDPAHLRRLLAAQSSAPVVLVVDQCEELFTLASDQEAVRAFCANLLHLAAGGPHTVILTLRSEFEPQVARLGDFYAAFQQGRFQVTPLSASQLREAIEEPAKLVGLKFEAGLVEALVNEILGEPAGLPLLQFTLLELWHRREKNRVTWQAYKALGGAREALTHVADRFYEQLIPQEQEIVRRVLTRLGWTDGGVEVLRNRVAREVLHKVGGTPDATDRVLEKLVQARLLSITKDELAAAEQPSPNDQFEVAHEALIRNWRRLVRWLEEERETMRQRLRLRAQAEQWRAHDKDPGGLLGGSLLAEALRYYDLDKLEEEFVAASQAGAERAEREAQAAQQREVEAQQRELEQARALAAAQRRSNRRLRWAALVMMALFVLASGMAAYGLQQRSEALQQSSRAEAQARFASEEGVRATRIAQENERLATEAHEVATEQAKKAEMQRMREQQLRIKAEDAQASAVKARQRAEEAEQVALAALASAETQQKRAEDLAKQLQAALTKANQGEQSAKEQAALANTRKEEMLVALAKLEKEKQATDEALKAKEAAEVLANQTNNRKLRELERAALENRANTSFSPDGKTLLTISADNKAHLWDASSGQLLTTLADSSAAITSAAFAPSGKYVATAGRDGTVSLWDTASGRQLRSFKDPGAALKLEFSPDGHRLGIGSANGETRIYEVGSGEQLSRLQVGRQPVIDISFSRDAETVATTDATQRTTLWKISADGALRRLALADAVCRPASLEMANISLTNDLRLSVEVGTICPGSSSEKDEQSQSAIDPAKARIRESMRKTVDLTLEETPPAKADSGAQPKVAASSRPPLKPTLNPGGGLEKQFNLVLDIYRRDPQPDWEKILHLSSSGTAGSEVGAAIEQLTQRGLSDNQIKAISDIAYRYGRELEAFPNTDSKEYQALALSSGSKLLSEILKILGIAQVLK